MTSPTPIGTTDRLDDPLDELVEVATHLDDEHQPDIAQSIMDAVDDLNAHQQQIYRFETDRVKCGYCNYQTRYHYVVAHSDAGAQELFEQDTESRDDIDGRGFCAGCLVDEILPEFAILG